MTEEQIKKLRSYHKALSGLKRTIESRRTDKHYELSERMGDLVISRLQALATDFPDLNLVPEINKSKLTYSSGVKFFHTEDIISFIEIAFAEIETALDSIEQTPVTQKREFNFISDLNIRKVVERDYEEIQRSFIADCWKSVIILSGGTIEAILLDFLLQNETTAKSASSAPTRNNADISRWNLEDLINVGVEINQDIVGVEKLSHSVRQYRNLIHPGNEVRNNLRFGQEEARIAIEVIHILHRELE